MYFSALYPPDLIMTNDKMGKIPLETDEIGQLVTMLAHDFNNLLTAIHGYSSLALQHANSDDQIRIYLEEIRTACDRATDLTQQLLTFRRNHSPTVEVQQEEAQHEQQFH
jgi:signal transduction histidine kinase